MTGRDRGRRPRGTSGAPATASSGTDPDPNASATADERGADGGSATPRAAGGGSDPDRRFGLSRREWGYVLLLSVPPGVGAAVGIDTTLRTGLLAPVALAAGAVTAATVFALVVAGLRTGAVDESLSPRDP